ncbi:hypothetical protein I33_2705 [Bacillus subtilis subsp. subtilis str. RO-NN-1]|nr:hypothetical protein I33_2705 [Bacillus subtilis subsp. subtilis str. RO-NN-1]
MLFKWLNTQHHDKKLKEVAELMEDSLFGRTGASLSRY